MKQEHAYGENVHLINDHQLNSWLAKFCSPETNLIELNRLCCKLYQGLLNRVINQLYPLETKKVLTRMASLSPAGFLEQKFLAEKQKTVVVSLARAGIYPSHVCFEELNDLFFGEGIRQDHFYINRKVNEKEEVVGVNVSGSKIGGGQDSAFVLLPDPMGATGGSLSFVIDYYKKKVEGQANKYVAMHLIVTPEYLKRMLKDHPDVEIFALRLDRGLSSKKALASLPGHYWSEEKGLTDKQYIVPGAGGVGEILNNSYV
jgi:uracil phosphoribosyltransferase